MAEQNKGTSWKDKAERAMNAAKRLRENAATYEAKATEIAMDIGREVVTFGTTYLGAYWAGAYGEKWSILGFDASLAIGVPALIIGYLGVAFGYDTIGGVLLSAGRGLVAESLARRGINAGIEAAKKAAQGAPGYAPPASADRQIPASKGWDWSGGYSGVRQQQAA